MRIYRVVIESDRPAGVLGRLHYLTRQGAEDRVLRLYARGYRSHVERSQPIEWETWGETP